MKKKIFAVLTAVMMLSFSMTALAAPSVKTEDIKTETVSVAKDAATVVKAADVKGATLGELTNAQVEKVVAAADELVAAKAEVKAVFDLTIPTTAEKDSEGFYTISVTVDTLTADAKVAVIHLGDKAEQLAATVSGKVVTFKTKSASPFAIVELPVETSVTSPATGFVNTMSVWPIVALICVAGLGVVAFTKKRAN